MEQLFLTLVATFDQIEAALAADLGCEPSQIMEQLANKFADYDKLSEEAFAALSATGDGLYDLQRARKAAELAREELLGRGGTREKVRS